MMSYSSASLRASSSAYGMGSTMGTRPSTAPMMPSYLITKGEHEMTGIPETGKGFLDPFRKQYQKQWKTLTKCNNEDREVATMNTIEDMSAFDHRIGIRMQSEEEMNDIPFEEKKRNEREEFEKMGIKPVRPPRPPSPIKYYDYSAPDSLQKAETFESRRGPGTYVGDDKKGVVVKDPKRMSANFRSQSDRYVARNDTTQGCLGYNTGTLPWASPLRDPQYVRGPGTKNDDTLTRAPEGTLTSRAVYDVEMVFDMPGPSGETMPMSSIYSPYYANTQKTHEPPKYPAVPPPKRSSWRDEDIVFKPNKPKRPNSSPPVTTRTISMLDPIHIPCAVLSTNAPRHDKAFCSTVSGRNYNQRGFFPILDPYEHVRHEHIVGNTARARRSSFNQQLRQRKEFLQKERQKERASIKQKSSAAFEDALKRGEMYPRMKMKQLKKAPEPMARKPLTAQEREEVAEANRSIDQFEYKMKTEFHGTRAMK